MIHEIFLSGAYLPYAFALLLALSALLYAILDGYDLGVGMLSALGSEEDREVMIGSIGPFWDANETWLVLAVGLLLVAFPVANGIVLTTLYLPVTLMILALVLRGVSFEFRRKAPDRQRRRWDWAFFTGSLLVAVTQGYILGRFVTGLRQGWAEELFSLFFGLIVVAGYTLMGATWLIMKAHGELQKRALRWARRAVWTMLAGAFLSSAAAPFTDTRIYQRMFVFPELMLLLMFPLVSILLTLVMDAVCRALPLPGDRLAWMPFAIAIAIFGLGFTGLAYSVYPDIIPGRLAIQDAAAAPESLQIMLIGTLIVLPFLIGYTALSYYIFRGKAGGLRYD